MTDSDLTVQPIRQPRKPAGRAVPPLRTATSKDLTVQLDVDNLSIGCMMDLEAAQTTTQVVEWLVAYTNLTLEDLRPLPFGRLREIASQVGEAVKEAVTVSK